MKKWYLGLTGLLTVAAIFAILMMAGDKAFKATRPMAYVACESGHPGESRVYRVDLQAGRVRGISDPIKWAGHPKFLVFDAVYSRLYIGSEVNESAGPSWPVTALRVGGGKFEIVKRYATNGERDDPNEGNKHQRRPDKPQDQVFHLAVSPDGNELFVSHSGLNLMLTAVWDAHTGEVLREIRAVIRRNFLWSPDGDYAANFWPSSKVRVRRRGEFITQEAPGGFRVFDVRSGSTVLSEDVERNKGMHPPWGRIEEPFIFHESNGERIVVYDRDTGEIVSEFDLRNATEQWMRFNYFFAILDNERLIALSATKGIPIMSSSVTNEESRNESYVVLVDVIDQREISRTTLAGRCTAPVVAYE